MRITGTLKFALLLALFGVAFLFWSHFRVQTASLLEIRSENDTLICRALIISTPNERGRLKEDIARTDKQACMLVLYVKDKKGPIDWMSPLQNRLVHLNANGRVVSGAGSFRSVLILPSGQSVPESGGRIRFLGPVPRAIELVDPA